MQAEWTGGAIQRITTGDVTLHERRKAVRSNLRFQDRRVAGLGPGRSRSHRRTAPKS